MRRNTRMVVIQDLFLYLVTHQEQNVRSAILHRVISLNFNPNTNKQGLSPSKNARMASTAISCCS
jgi:hypothetical protein